MKRIASLALGISLAFAGAAVAGSPVDLKTELFDDDGRITLGDLFEDAGRASAITVAPGPQAGLTVVLDAGRVQQIAWANGLEWSNPNGYRRLVVKGEARVAAPAAASAKAVPGSKAVETLTYARSLAAGEIVRPEDVVWTKVQSHLVPADSPRDAEAVIGQAARRPLREGAAVAGRDLSSPRVIKRDDIIQVAYLSDGVTLSMQGKALSDASAGQSVQVLNPQSKKTIEAVATGPGRAAVGPGADALKAPTLALR
jgi:flagella basal body P-ring formation protein FlgA